MKELRLEIEQVVGEVFGIHDVPVEVTVAPEGVEADYSCNIAMRLAGRLKKSPMEIAEQLRGAIEKSSSSGRSSSPSSRVSSLRPSLRSRVPRGERSDCGCPSEDDFSIANTEVFVSPPGFLNFISPDEYFVGKLAEMRGDFEKSISCDEYSGKTVVCEFSDPNPFKVLHVGHLYTSIVGDAISRMIEYAGGRVVRANFGGDVGLHVAKTLWVMERNAQEAQETSFSESRPASPPSRVSGAYARRSSAPSSKDISCASAHSSNTTTYHSEDNSFVIGDIAKCYVIGNKAYEEDEGARGEITELNKRIYEINKNDVHGELLADLYWQGRELSYQYFKDFYAQIGVKFDKFYPESSVAGLGLSKVREQLDAGVYEMSDGAVVFRGESYGLHTRVFINREGVPTYETKDVGLIFQKWQDWNFDESVVITGNEQADYMKVVLKSVEQYAPELVERTSHLTHGLVKLPGNVKMSSRLGNGLAAVEVLDMVADELENEYESEDWTVALGATKYAFLRYKMGGDIVFDPKESVKMTGNSGPYLQYACVRAKKVLSRVNISSSSGPRPLGPYYVPRPKGRSLRASGADAPRTSALPSEDNILTLPERSLTKKIVQYGDVLREAVGEKAPHKVCNYLYELAQEFSRFYENCPVAGDEREAVRAEIVAVYLDVMTHGLGLLGIEIPEEM